MDTLHYNMRFGYIDSVVRAHFTEFLTESDYVQLKQSETLEDLRLHLGNSGFQDFLQNDAGAATPAIIYERCMQRMVQRFSDVEVCAQDELKTFFQWIRIPYMIDNVVLLILGVTKHRDVKDLIDRCHPLGLFDGIKSLALDSQSTEELYHTVLVDTPLGPLFQKCFSKSSLNEAGIEFMRLKLYREYFDGFYEFCKNLGNETATQMCEVLEFEADRRSIVITLNSMQTHMIADEKESLYPRIGKLYPHATHLLSRAQTEADVARILDSYEVYRGLWAQTTQTKSIEDVFYERIAQMHVDSFSIFFQFGVFYAWTHLMDQEVHNIQWITECIRQRKRNKADSYVRIRS